LTWGRAARGAALLCALAGGSAGAAHAASAASGVEITPVVRQTLQQLQGQWLQWMSAYNAQRSEVVVTDLLATAHQLGMARLPDLSFGALARGVQAARQGDVPRAEWSLTAAERLDPGRPETAFAEATISRLEGRYFRCIGAWAQGFVLQFGAAMERDFLLQSLLLWMLKLLLVTGGLFVAIMMATRGAGLCHDLVELASRWLGQRFAIFGVVVLLAWPLLLPSGLLWLALFWSLLLWGYASASERAILIALWFVLGVSPLAMAEQRRHMSLVLSPPMQAVESLEQHRLYGDLFTDLAVLNTMLPDNAAVKQLIADLHVSLNQWDLARNLYRQVLEVEPRNAPAMINVGAYAFYKSDWHGAIQAFQQAASADPRSAMAEFDLSQAYSRSYMFDDQKRALAQAKEIDSERVDSWLRRGDQEHPVISTYGLARIPEIRRNLFAAWQVQEATRWQNELGRYGLPMLICFAMVVIAVTLHLVRRPYGYSQAEVRLRIARGRWGSWPRALLPGVSAAAAGDGARSFGALLLPAALATLPLFERFGYRIPWGYDPGNTAGWLISILGLALYLGARFGWELRNTV
jgi:tetratricopeptide (TPR) repeat protein